MDGVITNFEGRFKELFKCEVSEYENINGSESIWPLLNKYGIHFWANLPWMNNAKRLWRYVRQYDPIIISARPKLTISKYVEPGKRIWINRELGKHIPRHIGRRKDKIKQCKFGAILIDDYEKTIAEWREHGGIGIVHRSIESTIKQLSQWKKEK